MNCCSQTQFSNREMPNNPVISCYVRNNHNNKCLAIKFFARIFLEFGFKKYNCKSMDSCNRKIWLDIPSYTSLFKPTDNKYSLIDGEQGNFRFSICCGLI